MKEIEPRIFLITRSELNYSKPEAEFMKRQFAKRLPPWAWAIASILAVVIVYRLIPEDSQSRDHRNPSYPSSYSNWVDYQINPSTILASLELGETNIFTPTVSTPDPDAPLLPSGSVSWAQSDFMKIANALSQFVWNETLQLKDWNIYYLSFGRECQDNSNGFDWMEITYYKISGGNWKKTYPTRHIEIYPLASVASTGSSSDFDSRYYRGSNRIDFTKFNITADNALQLAEEVGGKTARVKGENNCLILVRQPNHNTDDNWDVIYYPTASSDFEMLVDPYTGIYRILDDK